MPVDSLFMSRFALICACMLILTAPLCAGTITGLTGLYVYPKNGQSAAQQQHDENACYDSARAQTGVNPGNPAPPPQQAQQQRHVARGAAGGAAVGAATGAVLGNAGGGAAAGAILGAAGGRRNQKNQEAQQQAYAQQVHQQHLATFNRAFSACMDARGYSVR